MGFDDLYLRSSEFFSSRNYLLNILSLIFIRDKGTCFINIKATGKYSVIRCQNIPRATLISNNVILVAKSLSRFLKRSNADGDISIKLERYNFIWSLPTSTKNFQPNELLSGTL